MIRITFPSMVGDVFEKFVGRSRERDSPTP
jgi:hypothetical protein